jgi:hypothetical protein
VYWDEPYNSEGSFTLEVRPTEENLSLLREGRWLVRTDAATRVPMRICHRSNENEDANLVVTGYPATWIFTKRVSASAIKNENAEAAMLALAKSAASWPKLEVAEPKGFDTTFEQQTSGNTLFDYFKTVGAACDLGFRVILMGKNSAKKLMFEVWRPTADPNNRFSTKWGSLREAILAGQAEFCQCRLPADVPDALGVEHQPVHIKNNTLYHNASSFWRKIYTHILYYTMFFRF